MGAAAGRPSHLGTGGAGTSCPHGMAGRGRVCHRRTLPLLQGSPELPGMEGVEEIQVDKDVVAGTKEPVRLLVAEKAA